METTTQAPPHLLSPQRIDQLVREHYDPSDWPAYPAELIAQYDAACEAIEQLPAMAATLEAAGLNVIEHAHDARVAAHVARLEQLDAHSRALAEQIGAILDARRRRLEDLYRALPPVAAERSRTDAERYLGAQQWLLHVQRAVQGSGLRRDRRENILAVAAALAQHARLDGTFLAGVVDVQAAAGIAHSTWTRAFTWLTETGLAHTLHSARTLTLAERALAVGSERHAHVRRWRAVIQLQHQAAAIVRPANWVPPGRRPVKSSPSMSEKPSTGLQPVDNGASRRKAAPSSRPATTKKSRRRWRQFDDATSVLWKRLQLLAERQTRTYLGNHPDVRALGSQIDAQRAAIIGCLRRCSPQRIMPHLVHLAAAGIEPAQLIAAIEAAEYRAGRDPARRTWNPDRRLIAALRNLTADDVVQL